MWSRDLCAHTVPRMRPLQVRLGNVVQRLRRAAGLSQEVLADRAHMHRTYIGAVERGEKNLSLTNLERIARTLGLRPSQLLGEAEQDS
jgi:transcriptional regulator with XRE-family HTH domain